MLHYMFEGHRERQSSSDDRESGQGAGCCWDGWRPREGEIFRLWSPAQRTMEESLVKQCDPKTEDGERMRRCGVGLSSDDVTTT